MTSSITNPTPPFFHLKAYYPVGFKTVKYDPDFCIMCRDKLNNTCSECDANKLEECPVIQEEDMYYHKHCHEKLKAHTKANGDDKPKKPLAKVPRRRLSARRVR